MSGHEPPVRDDARTVVFVLDRLSIGGAESQLTTLLEARVDRRVAWRPVVLTLSSARYEELERRLRGAGVRIETVERAGRPFAAYLLALFRWYRRERPALVHTLLSDTAGMWERLAARAAGVPRIVHSDLSLRPTRTRSQRILEPLAHTVSHRIVANARAIARRLQREGVPKRKIRVVANGVDLRRFEGADGRAYRRAWGVGPEAFVVGFLGTLRPVKRPDLLLDAVSLLPERDRPERIVFAGDGPWKRTLEERTRADPWMKEHVLWLGVVHDVPDFLSAIDVLALVSDTEGLPNTVIEALAVGVPCIATRVSDVPDLVSDAGLLIGPGEVDALAAAFREMRAMGHEARRSLGARGKARVVRDYAIEIAADRFWHVHDELATHES